MVSRKIPKQLGSGQLDWLSSRGGPSLERVCSYNPDGVELFVPADGGETLMQSIKRAGIAELLALCGGVMACATCHVYVDERFISRLPPISEDEDDLLDSLSSRQQSSRLSCQLPFDRSFDDIAIQIAPEE